MTSTFELCYFSPYKSKVLIIDKTTIVVNYVLRYNGVYGVNYE